MHILAVGLNHHTAPVEIRERFSFAEDQLADALMMLKETTSIMECVVVSTCNRMEIYVAVDRLHICGHYIRHFMERWFQIPKSDFVNYLYIHEDEKAIEHLLRVTSGLDSMIIGETQIIGQVRSAFLLAQKQQTTGTLFNKLFKQAITMAKRAHAETAINDNAVSVSYAAVELGKQIFGHFRGKNVMIIGAGKMGELTLKYLQDSGVNQIVVANRTLQKAAELAGAVQGLYCSFEQLTEHLPDCDIIISSTGANKYILTKAHIEAALQHRRKSRPLFLIDIAVPRDLDPAIGELPNVFLYDIDDLKGIVESNLEQRRKVADQIEEMIAEEIVNFNAWYKTLGVGPVIRALQNKSAKIHEKTMDSLLNKLPDLSEREIQVIRRLSKSMLNQLMQDPILRVKEMAAKRNGDQMLDLFTEIFAIEEHVDQLTKPAEVEVSKGAARALTARELLLRS